MSNSDNYVEVAIIGAGLSGINTAYRINEAFPGIKYSIFEGRSELGGTWSFFKYPGLRSDSDLFSFGFQWNPWQSNNVIAEADNILEYLHKSVKDFGIEPHIKYEHKLKTMNWDSQKKVWDLTLSVGREGSGMIKEKQVQARWVVLGTGYYDYEKALPAVIPGIEDFKGQIVHPQFWPENLDVTDKKVVIIGSGATAITILPNIADKAEHVTIVQRSPSYISTLPKRDASAEFLKRWLPLGWATRVLRMKYLLLSFLFFRFCQAYPKRARKILYAETEKQLPGNIKMDPHFSPRYGPWDQRLCLCPDGDFYAALRSGRANMVTGHIENVTQNSILIKDQPENTLEADIIVTATGLKMLVGGGAQFTVDGKEMRIPDKMLWKGSMLQDVPNLISVIGYTNASWTLGADVAAKTLTRLMAATEKNGSKSATPTVPQDSNIQPQALLKMDSTYLLKGRGDMPKAGDKYPWLPRNNYFSDMWDATRGNIGQDIVFA